MSYFATLICLTLLLMPMSTGTADIIEIQGASARQRKSLRPLVADLAAFDETISEQRIEMTAQAMQKALEQQGYLSAQVGYEALAAGWRFTVQAGKRYHISGINWSIEDAPAEESSSLASLVSSYVGQPISNELLERIQQQGMNLLRQQGYAFARERSISVNVNQDTTTAAVTIVLNRGNQICFGTPQIQGLATVTEPFVRKRLCWSEGDRYSLDAVNRTRQALLNTRLFKAISVSLESTEPQDCANAIIKVVERPASSLSLGGSYATSEGPGFSAIWENRNLHSEGQRVYAEAVLAQRVQQCALGGNRPLGCFGSANLRTSLLRKEIPSFVELCAALTAGVSASGYWGTGAADLQLQALEVTHSPDNGRFAIVSLPLAWSWVGQELPNTKLNLSLQAAPAYAFGSQQSHYLPLKATITAQLLKPGYSVSFYGSLGAMLGSALDKIPLPSRFFEGSFEGLRGYAYQTVSPLDCCGTPIGGRSLLLFKADVTFKLLRDLHVGPFIDLGNVFASSWPDFNVKPLKSAGLALNYNSLFGPVRAAVAFPFDRRDCLDHSVFIYLAGGITF